MRKVIGYTIGLALLTASSDSTIMEYPIDGGIDPTNVHVNLTFTVDPTLDRTIQRRPPNPKKLLHMMFAGSSKYFVMTFPTRLSNDGY